MGNIGSDCWAVSGKHTASGKPILSCDPHLMKWLQSKWYMITLKWGEDEFLAGGTNMGVPVFSYGRSKHLTWGVTALNPDNSDLFVEKIEGDNFFYDGQWHPLRKLNETIKVRFGSDVV
jgi:penicillin G amidase